MGKLRNVVYLSEAQYQTILGGGTVSGISLSPDDVYLTPGSNLVDGPVTSTTNGIATFSDTTGSLLLSPSATVTPSGIISAAGYKTVDGAYNAPAYTFISAPTTGLFIPASGELGFTVSGAEKLKLTDTAAISAVNLQAPDIFLSDNNLYLGNLATDLKHNGIPDAEKSNWVLSYDATSRVFSVQITSASYYYVNGKRFDLAATTYAWPAHAITNGVYYFYFDAAGVRVTSAVNASWDIIETAQIAYVIYNAANDGGAAAGLLGYELHGVVMSSAIHKYEHLTNGTELVSLGALSGYSIGTSTAAAISWALASTQIADEDIFMSGITQAEANYTLGYFDATNNFHWRVSATIPIFKGSNNIIQYNPNGSGLVELSSNNEYVNYYIALTTGNDATKRVIVLPGQAKYTTLAAAEQETPVNFNHGTLPFQEIVIAYRITYKYTAAGATEAGKAQIAATPKIITFNNSSIAAASGSHALLSGRDVADSHPASAITNVPAGNIAATDVQSALNELDSEKLALAGGTMTGKITAWANQYTDDRTTAALDLGNSNIIGANSIYFADLSDNSTEGIHFYRGATTVDSLWAANGILNFTPNRTLGSTATDYTVYHSGNLTGTITSHTHTLANVTGAGTTTLTGVTTSAYNMGTTSATTTKATMQYNATTQSVEFIFA